MNIPKLINFARKTLAVSILTEIALALPVAGTTQISHNHAENSRLNWRPMHTAWSYWPDLVPRGPYDERITQMVLSGDRIYYISHGRVGCVDKLTGRSGWHREVSYGAGVEWGDLDVDDRYVYTAEKANRSNLIEDAPSYRLTALNKQTGKPVWERSFTHSLEGALCASSDRLMVPFEKGDLLCVDRNTGKSVWSKQVMTPMPDAMTGEVKVILQVSRQVVVLKSGPSGIAAFNLREGTKLWQYPSGSNLLKSGATQAMTVLDGTVYAFLYNIPGAIVDPAWQMAALDIDTGRRLWVRSGHAFSDSMTGILPFGGDVIGDPFYTVLAMRRNDGQTAWLGETARHEPRKYRSRLQLWQLRAQGRVEDAVLEVRDCAPEPTRKVTYVPPSWTTETIVAVSPTTGREVWRSQLEDGRGIDMICSDDKRVYISDRDSIRAVEDGAPAPLPTTHKGRRNLAVKMVQAEFNWPYYGEWPRSISSGNPSLTLLRLGSDSVPALMADVEHEVSEYDQRYRRAAMQGCYSEAWDSLAAALDLIADIGDRSCVPALIKELDGARSAEARGAIAEGLIKLGDPQAAPAVFRFAQSDTDRVLSRQSALYWVCRVRDEFLPQEQVTEYLTSSLKDAGAPEWLQLFARLDLLNNRGTIAKTAALAAFKRGGTGRLNPGDLVLADGYSRHGRARRSGFPMNAQIMSPTRDPAGRWWAAFYTDYLGDQHDLWLAQSEDGKKWTHPLFVMNLSSQCAPGHSSGRVTLKFVRNTLDICWEEYTNSFLSSRTILHHALMSIADITRDTDGDGLTDLLEKEIGTAPTRADTNGNGVPDGIDRNPSFRPHKLTDEEGIFQATVEALCQAGRTNQTGAEHAFSPIAFGGTDDPLPLFAPPGSAGVNIVGHPGPVLFRNPHLGAPNPYPLQHEGGIEGIGRFTRPHIDIGGVMADPDRDWRDYYETPRDPFSGGNSGANISSETRIRTWRDYFPYKRSHDGNRARVGYEGSVSDGAGQQEARVQFDVEVRKIDSEWQPIECRQVYAAGAGGTNHFSRTTAVPVVHGASPY